MGERKSYYEVKERQLRVVAVSATGERNICYGGKGDTAMTNRRYCVG